MKEWMAQANLPRKASMFERVEWKAGCNFSLQIK